MSEGWTDHFGDLKPDEERLLLDGLPHDFVRAVVGDWPGWTHDGQLAPPGDWRTWVLMAGRGFGKTLAGAQWIRAAVAGAGAGTGGSTHARPLEIALVGATIDEARRVMVDGRSGLLTVAADEIADWSPSRRLITFRSGARATLFSGASPDALRGPEHHLAWCDELAKWEKAQETWDMLQLGLRLGEPGAPWPRALITTTPRGGPVLAAILAAPDTVETGGSTMANPHLPRAFKARMTSLYAGTRLGAQELDGKLLTDAAGALWSVELLERCRPVAPSPRRGEGRGEGAPPSGLSSDAEPPHPTPFPPGRGLFTRIVIGVDPPSGDGTCGIVVCAKDEAGHAHVLADHSVTARTPEGWARAVADAARLHSNPPLHLQGRGTADGGGGAASEARGDLPVLIVAETNQGGRMVEAVLRTADPNLHVKPATARTDKSHRAEPVAHLFEAGKILLHGRFPALEAQLLGLIAGGGYEGPGASPDRADAMVWALTELMLKERALPSVRAL